MSQTDDTQIGMTTAELRRSHVRLKTAAVHL